MRLIKNTPIDMGEVLAHAKPKGVIHCGAFLAEELPLYRDRGISNRCWIEADEDTFYAMQYLVPPEDIMLNIAVCDKDEDIDFYVMNNGASSSILAPKKHLVKYPDIILSGKKRVKGRRLDSVVDEGIIDIRKFNFLMLDIQGAEYLALLGFQNNLRYIDAVMCEVNYEELYEGCPLVDQIDFFLSQRGFVKQWATIHETVGWGDAYYKRT